MTRLRALGATLALVAGLLVATSASTTATATTEGRWLRVHWNLRAYPVHAADSADDWMRCHGRTSDDLGGCWGRGGTTNTVPFQDKVRWEWGRQPRRCADFAGRDRQVWTHELYVTTHDGHSHQWVCGWVDRHWASFRVVSGSLQQGSVRSPIAPTSAVVADREHQGGPLVVHLAHQDGAYLILMRGWIHHQ